MSNTVAAGISNHQVFIPASRVAWRNGAALSLADGEPTSNWIEEINRVWIQGTGHTVELAKVLATARHRLPYGEWTQLWNSEVLPFSKRKGEMLVVIGDRLGWLDAQTFAHLPAGWSILYQLAQLDRTTFERLDQEGVIHPRLTLQDARQLVARFRGRLNRASSRQSNVPRRLRQFRDFVRRTLGDWRPDDCKLAARLLTGLLQQIAAGHRADPASAFLGPRNAILAAPRFTPAIASTQQPRITA